MHCKRVYNIGVFLEETDEKIQKTQSYHQILGKYYYQRKKCFGCLCSFGWHQKDTKIQMFVFK